MKILSVIFLYGLVLAIVIKVGLIAAVLYSVLLTHQIMKAF